MHTARLAIVASAMLVVAGASAAERPNIVYVLCDDLGYGDVQCLAPDTSRIATPNVNQLAKEGMVFTDAHSGSSVCTPTRYGILTGRYSWRTKLQKGVVTGFAPSLIDKHRVTAAGFLKRNGYATAAIGKWHLNFMYHDPTTAAPYSRNEHKLPPIGATIPDGPIHRGFDYFYGFHHSGDMEAVIENDQVTQYDKVINMLPRLARKAVEYIDSRGGKAEPFFLYLPLNSPHTPIVPAEKWQGKSRLGAYGDFVMQTDNVLGQVLQTLERNGMSEHTLVVFTSDNGCSKAAGIDMLAAQGHLVSATMRGAKADIWEGGHRIPLVVRWPGKVAPGTTCDQLICLTDFYATVVDILDQPIPADSCEDSVSFLPAMFGQAIQSTRRGVVHHSVSGHFAYRTDEWKLILARGSGGWSSPKENEVSPDDPEAQLYDLSTDPGEQHNLYRQNAAMAKKLLEQLTADVSRGRSTVGPASANDIPNIDLWKSRKKLGSGAAHAFRAHRVPCW